MVTSADVPATVPFSMLHKLSACKRVAVKLRPMVVAAAVWRSGRALKGVVVRWMA